MPKPNIGKGDNGYTNLFGSGQRFRKDEIRFEVLGTLDELNSFIGYVYATHSQADIKKDLKDMQNNLFIAQSCFAVEPGYTTETEVKFPRNKARYLEKQIEKYEKELPELTNFILPTGTSEAALLHICRTITRRLERRLIQFPLPEGKDEQQTHIDMRRYVNRLSDVFFVCARISNHRAGCEESLWRPH